MHITKLTLENFKSLKKIELVDLYNIVAFIGPNMAGKSSLFDALNFLKECSQSDLKDALAGRGGYSNIVWQKDSMQVIKFDITIWRNAER